MTKEEIIKEANELLKKDLLQIITNINSNDVVNRIELAIENRKLFIQQNLDF